MLLLIFTLLTATTAKYNSYGGTTEIIFNTIMDSFITGTGWNSYVDGTFNAPYTSLQCEQSDPLSTICWQLCTRSYIYRSDSTIGYQDIEISFTIEPRQMYDAGEQCQILYQSNNANNDWIPVFSTTADGRAVDSSVMLPPNTWNINNLEIKVSPFNAQSQSTSCCEISFVKLSGNNITDNLPQNITKPLYPYTAPTITLFDTSMNGEPLASTEWISNGTVSLINSNECDLSNSPSFTQCWQICGDSYIYRVDSTIKYKDIAIEFNLEPFGMDEQLENCQILYNIENMDNMDDWKPIYVTKANGRAIISTIMFPETVWNSQQFGIKIYPNTQSNDGSSCCLIAYMTLLANIWNITTENPTYNPTIYPSVSPTTIYPTTSPTKYPSGNPTTSYPSVSPTKYPSISPSTATPTTNEPTQYPTLEPTVYTSPLINNSLLPTITATELELTIPGSQTTPQNTLYEAAVGTTSDDSGDENKDFETNNNGLAWWYYIIGAVIFCCILCAVLLYVFFKRSKKKQETEKNKNVDDTMYRINSVSNTMGTNCDVPNSPNVFNKKPNTTPIGPGVNETAQYETRQTVEVLAIPPPPPPPPQRINQQSIYSDYDIELTDIVTPNGLNQNEYTNVKQDGFVVDGNEDDEDNVFIQHAQTKGIQADEFIVDGEDDSNEQEGKHKTMGYQHHQNNIDEHATSGQ